MRPLALILAATLVSSSLAQPCPLVGLPTGPHPFSINNPTYVAALLPHHDAAGPSLIAAGHFVIPPFNSNFPNFVARYQHGQWTPMSTGLHSIIRDVAHADLSANGGPGPSIYATGDSNSVFRWTGSQWSLVTTSIGSVGYDLLPHADAAGPMLLAAGGGSSGVYAWRGTGNVFTPYGGLTNAGGAIYRLRNLDDGTGPALFAVGSFVDNAHNVRYLAKLVNNQWTQHELPTPFIQQLSDMVLFDDGTHGPELYLAGVITSPSVGARVYRRRNNTWEPVGDPILVNQQALGPTLAVLDEGDGPRLYLGGVISNPGGPNPYSGLVRWNGAAWTAPIFLYRPTTPNVGAVHAMQRFDEDGPGPLPAKTFFGGAFNSFRPTPNTQLPAVNAEGIVQFIGTPATGHFESLSRGVGGAPGSTPPSARYELAPLMDLPDGPRLLIGGPFTRAGGALAIGAASIDASHAWTPHSLTLPGSDNRILAAVTFTINGERRIVARTYSNTPGVVWWDGAQWVPLPGLPVGGSSLFEFFTLNDDLGESLYAVTEVGVQRYQNNTWSTRASYSGGASAIKADLGQGPRLLIGCNFQGPGVYAFDPLSAAPPIPLTRVGPNTPTSPTDIVLHDDGSGPIIHIACPGLVGQIGRLGATSWEPLGSGVNGQPIELESFNDGDGPALYAAGPFSTAGGVQSAGIARWRNGAWSPVVQPFSPFPSFPFRPTLAVFRDRLYIAGEFYSIGTTNADHLAYIERCGARPCTNDYNNDGDIATDADIEAFFLCLSGTCCARCTADFDNDGDPATDADIESFFRVLAGGPC